MEGRLYAFLAVGQGYTEQGDTVRYVRIGRCKPDAVWQRLHHGPSTSEVTLMDVRVSDVRRAMSKLIEILRGNERYGPDQHRLGGWQDEMLYEKPAFGNSWFETVFSVDQLQEVFRNVGLEFKQQSEVTTGSV